MTTYLIINVILSVLVVVFILKKTKRRAIKLGKLVDGRTTLLAEYKEVK